MASALICIPVPCSIWRISATVRAVGAAAAGAAGGAIGRGTFDPEPDMVVGVHGGGEGFGGEMDESELIGGGGDLVRCDDTLDY